MSNITQQELININKISNLRQKKYRERLKIQILCHYSNGLSKCACCGDSQIRFLTIDHINGGGHKHNVKLQRWGYGFYQWLKTSGFPDGYRVLCFNCNHAMGHFGYCPHQKEVKY